ncbi:MAG: hypothetical protein B9S34_03785 [Opitutia bacterium Tous-C1TDCM]|nr:MAG: hypothetical protein B9S34_03785 [Opitutae bacterium Tous-C1TDCM]
MTKPPKFWELSAPDQRALYAAASRRLQRPEHMVEKDAWVCWTLEKIFTLPEARDHFIFKGGTSLSKVWQVIHRFSEDIDLSLSREWLGYSGAQDPEAATGKERKRRLDGLALSCAEKLRCTVMPALRERFGAELGPTGWSLEVAADDAQTLLFLYPGVFGEAQGSYVRPVVRIEGGARSDRWPVTEREIVAYVADAFPEAFPQAAFPVPVLDAERTFWEKATILHAEAHRDAAKATPDRFSRHYADLAALALHPMGQRAVTRDDLRARVVEHKQVFFAAAWARYETACPGTFRLVPPQQRLEFLDADYRAMRPMFFREPPSWKDVVAILSELEARINRANDQG